MTEAMAMLEALNYTISPQEGKAEAPALSFDPQNDDLVFFSDCALLIEALSSPLAMSWVAHVPVLFCKELLANFSKVKVLFYPKENNMVADWVAKMKRKKELPRNWISSPPQALGELLCTETLLSGVPP